MAGSFRAEAIVLFKKRLASTLLLVGLCWSPVVAQDIPVEQFFSDRELFQFRISPNGKTLSAKGLWNGKMNLFVIDLETRQPRRVTTQKKHSVQSYFWANDDRIVFDLNYKDKGTQGLFAVNADGSGFSTLVKPFLASGNFRHRYNLALDRFERSNEEVLVLSNDGSLAEFPNVYRLNVYTGKKTLFVDNPGNIRSWHTDWNGDVRLGRAESEEGLIRYYLRESPQSEWKEIASFPFGEPKWTPVTSKGNNSVFSHDGKSIYVSSDIGRNTAGIFAYDIARNQLGELIYGDDTYDVDSIIQSNHRKSLIGISYDAEKPREVYFDEERASLQAFLGAKFPEMVNVIVRSNFEETFFVVASYSDRVDVIYSLVKIEEGSLGFEILSSVQKVDPKKLSPVKPIAFDARDGLRIHGYLTLPVHKEPKNLPMIVHPHGGPWARDSWGFNPELQYLANRGFAVLQLNFRGSEGYGRKHLRAGDKTWGTDMQTDIVDGVNWAISEGYADPDRIGIFGSSYGGYATMAQLVYYPELYKFGICNVGPIDLPALIKWRKQIRQDATYAYYTRTIGDPKTESDLLEAHSPINFLQNLQAPLMIIHGTLDYRVPIDQATKLRRRLDQLGKEYVWLVKRDEGHGFGKEVSKFEQYSEMDKFLAPFRD